MQPLISHFTPSFQDLDWPHSPVYIIVNVSSSHTRLFYLERILQKNTWLAAILSDSGGGIFSELRDWPNSTQAKDLSVSAITIIAQFTFWLIPGASTMGEYLVYIQGRSCAQLRQTQHLFTPDRLLPSLWADSTDRRRCGETEMWCKQIWDGAGGKTRQEIGCDATKMIGQHSLRFTGVRK